MKLNRNEALSIVWDFYRVPFSNRDKCFGAVGWPEIANLLNVTVRHCQDLFRNDGFFSPSLQERICSVTYLALSPHRMTVFWCGSESEEANWDHLAKSTPILCSPEKLARCRSVGGPFFRHVVDLYRRLPNLERQLLDEINGGMATVKLTKARLLPVCWDTRQLLRLNRFRAAAKSVIKAAAGSGYSLDEYLRITSPNSGSDVVGA